MIFVIENNVLHLAECEFLCSGRTFLGMKKTVIYAFLGSRVQSKMINGEE